MRFDRFEALKDIDDAVISSQRVVDLTPDGHPKKPVYHSNLGTALQARFNQFGRLADVGNAIFNNQRAVDLTPDGHPEKPGYHSNLGTALRARFDLFGSLFDLENAILNNQRAVDLTPSSHPQKPRRLLNLGNALSSRLEWVHNPEDVENILRVYSKAAKSPIGSPVVRFRAARGWATHSDKHSRSSLSAYGCAIDLLPRIAWLGLPVTDQHTLLADVGGIVCKAVSTAIRLGKLETAVEWVEQGRSIVWQNMLGLRTPVDDLRAKHPHLADQIQNIA